MEKITLNSFAKINLFLEVQGRRPDGFHNIRTVFQTIDLADEVTVTKASGAITLFCDSPEVPLDKTNIAFKAAELILQENNIKSGLKITIKKNIP
ncbi:MAG: 4-(cytidine 5'-diphospho)-2-C-methyl-D-erythritol kinase, partial [Candidatus Firestonebacteria bacterium]